MRHQHSIFNLMILGVFIIGLIGACAEEKKELTKEQKELIEVLEQRAAVSFGLDESLLSVSSPDLNGVVTVVGSAGAVGLKKVVVETEEEETEGGEETEETGEEGEEEEAEGGEETEETVEEGEGEEGGEETEEAATSPHRRAPDNGDEGVLDVSGAEVSIYNAITGVSITASVGKDGSFSVQIKAAVGDPIKVKAILDDRVSNVVTLTVPEDTEAPAAPDAGLVSADLINEEGETVVMGLPGAVEQNCTLVISNTTSGGKTMVKAQSDGSFIARLIAEAGDNMELVCFDAAGNKGNPTSISVTPAIKVADEFRPTGIIQGAVYDSYTKEPISGARVTINYSGTSTTQRTDENGQYAFYDIPATSGINASGNYTISCDLTDADVGERLYLDHKVIDGSVNFDEIGKEGEAMGVNLLANNLDFAFGQLRAEITGYVYEDIALDPLVGVRVDLMGCEEGAICSVCGNANVLRATTKTTNDGSYSFTGIEEGKSYCVVADDSNVGYSHAATYGSSNQFPYALELGATTLVDDMVLQLSPTEDSVRPYVVSVSPAEDSYVEVANLSTDIVIEFSEALDETREAKFQAVLRICNKVIDAATCLSSPAPIPQTVTISGDKITINPDSDLDKGMTYKVYLGDNIIAIDSIMDLNGNAFDGSDDRDEIGATSFTFSTKSGACRLALTTAPTQIADTADNQSPAQSARASDSLNVDPRFDGDVDTDDVVLEWTEPTISTECAGTLVMGYKVYARLDDKEMWTDVTAADADDSSGVLSHLNADFQASLSTLDGANYLDGAIKSTTWGSGQELYLAVTVINQDGDEGALSSQVTAKDNTAPLVALNITFNSGNDSYQLSAGNLTLQNESADTVVFYSLGSQDTSQLTCCEYGQGIVLVKLTEDVTGQSITDAASAGTIKLGDGTFARACGLETDPNVSGSKSEGDAAVAGIAPWKLEAGNTDTIALLVDNFMYIDSGDTVDITGVKDIAGNEVTSGVHPDSDTDNDLNTTSADWDLPAFVDKIEPMIKAITYTAATDSSKSDTITIEFTEWIEQTTTNDFTMTSIGDDADPVITAVDNSLITSNITGSKVTITVDDLSYLEDGGTIKINDITDVALISVTTQGNVNNDDSGRDAYAFLATLPEDSGKMKEGAYGDDNKTSFADTIPPRFWRTDASEEEYGPNTEADDNITETDTTGDGVSDYAYRGPVSTNTTITITVVFTEPVDKDLIEAETAWSASIIDVGSGNKFEWETGATTNVQATGSVNSVTKSGTNYDNSIHSDCGDADKACAVDVVLEYKPGTTTYWGLATSKPTKVYVNSTSAFKDSATSPNTQTATSFMCYELKLETEGTSGTTKVGYWKRCTP